MHVQDITHKDHDKDVHYPLDRLHHAFAGRRICQVRTVGFGGAVVQQLQGPHGAHSGIGEAEGGILLNNGHVTALFPMSPDVTPEAAFAELVHRARAAGALLPTLATLLPAVALGRLQASQTERPFGARELIPCPFCQARR